MNLLDKDTGKYQILGRKVFNSDEETIAVIDNDGYGGCHQYVVKKCLGFHKDKTRYAPSTLDNSDVVHLQFVHKTEDGGIIGGLQNEQLYIVCLDRLEKMNTKYPDPRNEIMIHHLQELLRLSEERVKERIDRGVMGELKK